MNKEDVEYDSDEQEEREKLRKEKEEMKDDSKIIIAVRSVEKKILKKEDQLKRLRLLVESLPDDDPEPTPNNTIVNSPSESVDSYLNQNEEYITKESCNLQIQELEEQIALLKSVLSRLDSHVKDFIGDKDIKIDECKNESNKKEETNSSKSTKKKKSSQKKSTNQVE